MAEHQTASADDLLLDLDAAGPGPLRARLERALRDAVDDGRVPPGARLPASRELADRLGISRWSVTEAYGQLVAEGFLEARSGSGTRVPLRPAGRATPGPATAPGRPARPPGTTGPNTGRRSPLDLAAGVPDLRAVPRAAWSRAARDALAEVPHDDLAAPEPAGHPGLRKALAAYLARSRAARCTPDDVLVTHGATDAMATLVGTLRAAGHGALLVEEPSWPRLRDVAAAGGLTPVPVPVDADGVDTELLLAAAARTGARAALLTPAHQFPVGAVLAPERRDAVVRWAQDVGGLVVEDDYDAEFRYDRRPVGTLQGVAPEHVALLGSLSKTLSPAFALGWAVVPPALRDAALRARTVAPSTVDQLTFARLLRDGGYERHLRSTRRRYARRRAALLAALAARLPGCDVSGVAAGMHLVLALPPGTTGADVARRAADHGVTVTDARRYRTSPTSTEALVVGYGNLADTRVAEAVDVLGSAVDAAARGAARRTSVGP